jgi:hypothetical protein
MGDGMGVGGDESTRGERILALLPDFVDRGKPCGERGGYGDRDRSVTLRLFSKLLGVREGDDMAGTKAQIGDFVGV